MIKKQIILVTGGAGFIGINLCFFLLNKDFKVICLDNYDNYYPKTIKEENIEILKKYSNFIFIEGDVRDKVLLEGIFSEYKIEIVIHLAAKAGVRSSIENPNEYFDINVNGHISLLEIMKKHSVKKLIFSSSSSVYGNKKGKLTEKQTCDELISPYAISKRTAEMLNYHYHLNFDFCVMNLRLFSVYGRHQRPDLVLHKFIHRISNNLPIEIYGDKNTQRDYTYIDDVVNAFYLSIEYFRNKVIPVYEEVNIANGNSISLERLIDIIKKVTEQENIEMIFQYKQKGDVFSTSADISKAQKILNYYPKTTIETGIILFYEWYKKIFI